MIAYVCVFKLYESTNVLYSLYLMYRLLLPVIIKLSSLSTSSFNCGRNNLIRFLVQFLSEPE